MSEQRYETSEILVYVHGHSMKLSPANGYVFGAVTAGADDKSVLTIQRDDVTGKLRIVIDKK
jgi:hypothetical protein